MKIKVRLKCQHDDGKVVLPPGTETDMERDQAMAMANMGMVEIIKKENPAKDVKVSAATKSGSKKPKKDAAGAADAAGTDGSEDEGFGNSDSEIPDPDSLVE